MNSILYLTIFKTFFSDAFGMTLCGLFKVNNDDKGRMLRDGWSFDTMWTNLNFTFHYYRDCRTRFFGVFLVCELGLDLAKNLSLF